MQFPVDATSDVKRPAFNCARACHAAQAIKSKRNRNEIARLKPGSSFTNRCNNNPNFLRQFMILTNADAKHPSVFARPPSSSPSFQADQRSTWCTLKFRFFLSYSPVQIRRGSFPCLNQTGEGFLFGFEFPCYREHKHEHSVNTTGVSHQIRSFRQMSECFNTQRF